MASQNHLRCHPFWFRDFPRGFRENPFACFVFYVTFAAEIKKQNVESSKEYDYEEDVVYPGYHADDSSIG